MGVMKGVTIKLPAATLQRLRQHARETGRSVAAVIRERVDTTADRPGRSVYALTSDLAGALAGRPRAATNTRRRFGRW